MVTKTPLTKILLIALKDEFREQVLGWLDSIEPTYVTSEDEFDENFESYQDGQFALVLCGDKLGVPFCMEVAQLVRNQCPSTKTLFAISEKDDYRPKELIKNGATHSFLTPSDNEFLKQTLEEVVAEFDPTKVVYRPISIVDLQENSVLEFDTFVYLPMNKKYIKYSKSGNEFGEEKLKKLKTHSVSSLFIDHKNMNHFYEYTASLLKGAVDDSSLSSTEKQQKLEGFVRDLFSNIFDQGVKSDFESGKELLTNCKNIVSTYITGSAESNWYTQLLKSLSGQGSGYNHSSEVSTIAALIAMGIGLPNVEDLALAGFLHDISSLTFSKNLIDKPEEEWDELERKEFQDHPQTSLNVIKQKKMIITPEVETAILQHHEKFNGQGYPKGLAGAKISMEAQVLSFADQFQYLTSYEMGKKRMNPQEAFAAIAKNGSIGPELISKVRKLFDGALAEKAS